MEIELDSTTIPQGMAATGTIHLQSESSSKLVFSRGVGIRGGGISWRVSKPNGRVFEISRNTSKTVISGSRMEFSIEPGASLNIPFCLFVWNRDLIFDTEGIYHLIASVFLKDGMPPLVQEIQIHVTKGGEGFQSWLSAFVPMGEVISPFELGFYNYNKLIDTEFSQTTIYGPCLDQLFVYNTGSFNLYPFLTSDSFGNQENVSVEELSKNIEQGRMLAQKTGYGLKFWDFISARFKYHYPDQGNFIVENVDYGNWRIR